MKTRFPSTEENGDDVTSRIPRIPNQWIPETLKTVTSTELQSIQFNAYTGSKDDIPGYVDGCKEIVNALKSSKCSMTFVTRKTQDLVSVKLSLTR